MRYGYTLKIIYDNLNIEIRDNAFKKHNVLIIN